MSSVFSICPVLIFNVRVITLKGLKLADWRFKRVEDDKLWLDNKFNITFIYFSSKKVASRGVI